MDKKKNTHMSLMDSLFHHCQYSVQLGECRVTNLLWSLIHVSDVNNNKVSICNNQHLTQSQMYRIAGNIDVEYNLTF